MLATNKLTKFGQPQRYFTPTSRWLKKFKSYGAQFTTPQRKTKLATWSLRYARRQTGFTLVFNSSLSSPDHCLLLLSNFSFRQFRVEAEKQVIWIYHPYSLTMNALTSKMFLTLLKPSTQCILSPIKIYQDWKTNVFWHSVFPLAGDICKIGVRAQTIATIKNQSESSLPGYRPQQLVFCLGFCLLSDCYEAMTGLVEDSLKVKWLWASQPRLNPIKTFWMLTRVWCDTKEFRGNLLRKKTTNLPTEFDFN